jgi:UDP-N-acetylmuramyl pentapeptide synthase
MEHAWKSADRDPSAAALWWTDRMETLSERLGAYVRAGDLVLLKGSRGLELERLLPLLAERGARGGAAGGPADARGPRC